MSSKPIETSSLIDEGLYSRQLYVIGANAMKKMADCKVLLCGLHSLGGEAAKNLVLAGLQNLVLYDLSPTPDQESVSNKLFLENDKPSIHTSRGAASLKKLQELNPNVFLSVREIPLSLEELRTFQLIILAFSGPRMCQVCPDLPTLSELTSFCHQNGIHVVLGETRGLFFRAFSDFGEDFLVSEPDQGKPAKVMVTKISNDCQGLVTCLVDKTHGFQAGDGVIFSEIQGMEDMGTCGVVEVLSANSFTIGDTSGT